jgi:hydroxyacylglutathione hydrolase
LDQISVHELKERLDGNAVDIVVDVRRENEWNSGHIDQSRNIPLNHLMENLRELNPDDRIAVICAGGFRSSIAVSILQQPGFARLANVVGGMAAWQNASG